MADMHTMVELHDGRQAPRVGFGVWQIEDDAVAPAVETALATGYRLIDTAAIYGNEAGTGRAIRASGLPREQVFITTKLWNDRHGHDSTAQALTESLERLGLDYIDLYLIHWPAPARGRYVEAWESMIRLQDEGLVRSIGVSNFTVDTLQALLDETGVLPVINQIELHPRFQQAALRAYHAEHGIATQAWSPLGQGRLWDHPVLLRIANRHGRSLAQIVLRWHLQLGNMVIPKSVTPDRIRENFQIFDFALDTEDMAAIAALDEPQGRCGPDPDTFD